MKPNPDLSYLKKLRSSLQKNSIVAEAELWKYLKSRKLKGRMFTRKHPLGNYIIDFFCASENLAVSLGSDPNTKKDKFLNDQKIKAINIENQKVFEDISQVLTNISSSFKND